jgi:hypothetical protein
MKLYTLYGGRSKKKMTRLETNSKSKCENYRDALNVTPTNKYKWFEIREALPEEELKVHKSQNKWTGYNESGPKIIRKGNK